MSAGTPAINGHQADERQAPARRTAVVALGVDAWKSVPRHPAPLLAVGLANLGWQVIFVCLYPALRRPTEDFFLSRCPNGQVRVLALAQRQGRRVRIEHTVRKLPALIRETLTLRSLSEARRSLSHISEESRFARELDRLLGEKLDSIATPTFVFGDNVLTRQILSPKEGWHPSAVYVETGDWQRRSQALEQVLRSSDAVLVSLDPNDAPRYVRSTRPILFPVTSRFPRQIPDALRTGPRVVGYVGRLHPEKRPWLVIEVCRALRREGIDACALIVGDGSESERLKSFAASVPWADVRSGETSDSQMLEIYRGLDCLVIPSTKEANEGLPVSALEALVLGVPVVATAVGAIEAAIGDLVRVVSPDDFLGLAESVKAAIARRSASSSPRGRIPDESRYAELLIEAAAVEVGGNHREQA